MKFQDENLKNIVFSMLDDEIIKEKYYQVLTKSSDKPVVKHKKTNQITIVLKGSGLAVINNEKINFNENDILYIAKNNSHCFISKSDKIELFHIHLPYEFIETDREILKDNYNE